MSYALPTTRSTTPLPPYPLDEYDDYYDDDDYYYYYYDEDEGDEIPPPPYTPTPTTSSPTTTDTPSPNPPSYTSQFPPRTHAPTRPHHNPTTATAETTTPTHTFHALLAELRAALIADTAFRNPRSNARRGVGRSTAAAAQQTHGSTTSRAVRTRLLTGSPAPPPRTTAFESRVARFLRSDRGTRDGAARRARREAEELRRWGDSMRLDAEEMRLVAERGTLPLAGREEGVIRRAEEEVMVVGEVGKVGRGGGERMSAFRRRIGVLMFGRGGRR